MSIQLGFLIVKQQGSRTPSRCLALWTDRVLIAKQQGSRVPSRCIASWKGGVLIIFLPYLLNFIFYISLSKLNIENIIKAIDTPVLTVFLTLISFVACDKLNEEEKKKIVTALIKGIKKAEFNLLNYWHTKKTVLL